MGELLGCCAGVVGPPVLAPARVLCPAIVIPMLVAMPNPVCVKSSEWRREDPDGVGDGGREDDEDACDSFAVVAPPSSFVYICSFSFCCFVCVCC